MGSDRIGVGIIGSSANGGWAATAHVPALRALGNHFDIVALTASSANSAALSARAHNVPTWHGSALELVHDPAVDLVVVAVKVPFHAGLVRAALSVGKHVLCEWPLGRDPVEAEALAASARAASLRGFVGLQARSSPALRFIRDLVQQGFVGDVLSTSLLGSGEWPWGGETIQATAYTSDRTTGATMLTIPFGHTIDGLAWTLGDIQQVTATVATLRQTVRITDTGETMKQTSPDQVAITGTLASGVIVSAHYRGGRSRGVNFLWEINGTEGDLQIVGDTGHLQYGFVSIKGGRRESPLEDMPIPTTYRNAGIGPDSYGHSTAHLYLDIFQDLKTGRRTAPTFEDAVKTHRLLAAIDAATHKSQETCDEHERNAGSLDLSS